MFRGSSSLKIDIPALDPRAGLLPFRSEILHAIEEVIDSGSYILGDQVDAFEAEFTSYIGANHGIGVGNGTDAIALALHGLGIGPGDEVITVSMTAVATVAAIEQAGATPVFVDVEHEFSTLDPAQLDDAITSATKAVLPVHLYGQAADLAAIASWCSSNNIALVEDVAQAHGGELNGRLLGSFGDASAFSFYPTKNLGGVGDGGMVMAADGETAQRVREVAQYGWRERNVSLKPGVNSRLDELQAAVLRIKLRHFAEDLASRRGLAATYRRNLAGSPVRLLDERPGSSHAYHLFVVQVDKREEVRYGLAQAGIGTSIHYPYPVHAQPSYAGRIRCVSALTATDALAKTVLSLPLYPGLKTADIDRVCEELTKCV
jgi:dTDP-4-amino-4,6-dideoxygalactose transaminase